MARTRVPSDGAGEGPQVSARYRPAFIPKNDRPCRRIRGRRQTIAMKARKGREAASFFVAEGATRGAEAQSRSNQPLIMSSLTSLPCESAPAA